MYDTRTQTQTAEPEHRATPHRRPRLPGVKILPRPVRKLLRHEALAALRHDGPAPGYDAPLGDPGLFGPASVTWKIHADFPAMMAGGLAALMLQSLHPLALAGVWDHSNFWTDPLGRLQRTISFVARTTYAPRAAAEAAIEHVNRIHAAVKGTSADGRAYSADDPHLLAWVHCTECWGFLHGYQTYCQPHLARPLQDQYLREMAKLAAALGAPEVPQSASALDDFLRNTRPDLAYDDRTAEVMRVLGSMRLPMPMAGLSRGLFLGAAATLLPDWALRLMGRTRFERLRDRAARFSLKLAAPSIRDALAEGGLARRACARTGSDYEDLFRWPAAKRTS